MRFLITKTFLVYEHGEKDNMDNYYEVEDLNQERALLKEKYQCKTVYFSFIDLDLGDKSIHHMIGLVDATIAEVFGTTVEQMKDKLRKRESTEARQFAMWWHIRNNTGSLKTIGKMYGGRDHATALHAKKTINNLMETNKLFREKANLALTIIEQIKL